MNWFLGQAYLMAGLLEDAVSAFQHGVDRSGRHPGMVAYLAHAYARTGRQADALELLAELEERARRSYVPADYLSVVRLAMGRTDEALKGLGEAFEERALHLAFLGVDPVFDSLRSEAKFTELLHKIGLAPY